MLLRQAVRVVFRLSLLIIYAGNIVCAGTKSIPVGSRPTAVVTDPAFNAVYVANSDDSTVSVIDASTNQVTNVIQVGDSPTSLAVDRQFQAVYVPSYTKNFVEWLDERTHTLPLLIPQVGNVPSAIAVDPITHRLYVALHNDKAIRVIDVVATPVTFITTIPLAHIPVSVAIDSHVGSAGTVYVVMSDGSVAFIDEGSNSIGTTISVGASHGIAVNLDTHQIYVTTASGVAVITGAGVKASIATGPGPWALAVNPLTKNVFVTDVQNSTVAVVDGQASAIVARFPVGRQPIAISVMESTGFIGVAENQVYVANYADNTISVLFDPTIPRDVITLPVRWCAIEGSSTAGMTTVPKGQMWTTGNSSTDNLLLGLLRQASDSVWLPGAHIVFRSAVAKHFPIIADPDPPDPQIPGRGSLGDINGAHSFAAEEAGAECNAAWAALYPDQRGTIVVNARLLLNTAAVGVTVGTSPDLVFPGSRNRDLCTVPRQLTTSDVTSSSAVVDDASDASKSGFQDDAVITLAHELGHTLLLGHGDGIDNDNDGTLPPNPGLRSYDQYCDPLGVINNNGDIEPKEDSIGQRADGCGSLMISGGICTTLRPLQVETARDVAQLVPGGVFGNPIDPAGQLTPRLHCQSFTCGIHPDIFLEKVEVAQTPRKNITEFSHRVLGPIPPGANNQYAVFANLRGKEQHGCSPSSLGFPTGFQGAELVTSVLVRRDPRGVQAVGSAWRCEGGKFMRLRASDILTRVSNQVSSENPDLPSAVSVTIQLMPSADLGNLREIRMEAIARRMEESRSIHRLPEEGDNGTIVPLIPPVLPQCLIAPEMIRPGALATVEGRGLPSNTGVDIYLGNQSLATVFADATGVAHATVGVPSDARPGLRLMSVQSRDSVSAAVCTAEVVDISATEHQTVRIKQRLAVPETPLRQGTEFVVNISAFNGAGTDIKSFGVDEYFDPEYLEYVKSSVEPDAQLSGRLEWDDWTGSLRGFGSRLERGRLFKASVTFKVKKCTRNSSTIIKMEGVSGIDAESHPIPRISDTLKLVLACADN